MTLETSTLSSAPSGVIAGIEAVRACVEAASPVTFQDDDAPPGGPPDDPSVSGPRAPDEECPVAALGHHDGTYWFLSPSGELRSMKVRDFSANGLLSLFSGDQRWMVENFQRTDKDGNPINDFIIRGVVGHLIRACEKVGLFDPGLRLRGKGVWSGGAGEDGRPAVFLHAGNRVARVADGRLTWHKAGYREGNVVYPARPRMALPDFDAPAAATDGEGLLERLSLWRFEDAADVGLVAGVFGVGLLAGYPPWRVHGQVAAEHGSGKSALCKFLSKGLGPQAESFNSFTEAGMRQVLADEARVAVLDEAESDGGGAMQAVIGLIRRMSGDAGADVVRGSPSGEVKRYTVTGVAWMAGINPPPLSPQDRSRILRFNLLKATSDPGAQARVDAAIAWMTEMSPRWRARALLHAGRFTQSAQIFRNALMHEGCDGRQADLLAVTLAGRDLLLHDHLPDPDSIAELIAPLRPRIAEMRDADKEDSDGQQCWNHLLSFVPDHWRSGARTTIGELVAAGRDERGVGENSAALKTYGLRLLVPEGQTEPWLLVATRHTGLLKIFHGTTWAGGAWVTALKRLSTDEHVVDMHPKPERFAGPSSRCLRIPPGLLPEREVYGS